MFGENRKLIQRSIAKILPFVNGSVAKAQGISILLETDQLEDLGLLGLAMNGIT